jgi:Zn-dependent protease
MDFHNALIQILVYALPVIFAITLHEAAHGYVAKHFGDSTAYMLGRVTLNPVKHIDPLGTVVIPIATMLAGGFLFGWAKPVPVNFQNLRSPKRDSLWVAFAGPFANMVQVVIWAVVAKVLIATVAPSGLVGPFWLAVAEAGISLNIMFAVLNLLPILPLDGGRILMSLLPNKLSYSYSRSEPYGLFILLALVLTGALSYILGPVVRLSLNAVARIFGFQ